MRQLISCQAVANKMHIEMLPNELKDFRTLEETLIFKRILSKKLAIMHEIDEFVEVKGNICKLTVETENVYNILPLTIDDNGLIVVKL